MNLNRRGIIKFHRGGMKKSKMSKGRNASEKVGNNWAILML